MTKASQDGPLAAAIGLVEAAGYRVVSARPSPEERFRDALSSIAFALVDAKDAVDAGASPSEDQVKILVGFVLMIQRIGARE